MALTAAAESVFLARYATTVSTENSFRAWLTDCEAKKTSMESSEEKQEKETALRRKLRYEVNS